MTNTESVSSVVASNPDGSSSAAETYGRPEGSLRLAVYTIIFEADTRAGRAFDIGLIAAILASVLVVILDSVQSITARYGGAFDVLEWFFTLLFTVEYLLRLWCVRHPLRYATSFFGIVDLLSVLPTYIAFFVPEVHALIDVRMLRLLRIFRILKLGAYVSEFRFLGDALLASRRKIVVFIGFVLVTVTVLGTLMYVVEGPENGYTSIPVAIYWGITTITTVGFGDITPKTDLGRFIASMMMLMGWGILAVPTGIVTAEMTARRAGRQPVTTRTCHECLTEGHDADALYCRHCGKPLPEYHRD
jgi:voltage-gated potassium channel